MPLPETIQFELYWECLDGEDRTMKTGVEAYAICIHLSKATTKKQKNEILDKHGFRKMTGFHRRKLTDDFQPAVFSNADLKLAKKELKQALHHKQAKALEH